MIHRVVFGSIERFIGIITEHFAGAFPLWIAPVQVEVLPVTDRAAEYAGGIVNKLQAAGFRAEADYRPEKLGYKIREAQGQKIPYMIIVGDKDMENGTISVRHRAGEDLGALKYEEFEKIILEERDSKAVK
jgi:threonyl-tRNA synthetase